MLSFVIPVICLILTITIVDSIRSQLYLNRARDANRRIERELKLLRELNKSM